MSVIDARIAATGWQIDRRDLDRVQAALGDLGQVEDIYPLAPLQQGLLFHSLYSPGSTFYISTHAVDMQGVLDIGAMESAWHRVVRRHGILRSVFVARDLGTPLQVVLQNLSWTVGYLDFGDYSPEEQRLRLGQLDADHVRDFDFLRPPLMRVSIVRLGPDSHRLLWSCHHVLLDGWSTSILFNEVFSSYLAAVRKCAVRLPRAVPYRDYVAWLMQQDEARLREYWQGRLAGFRAATTPDIRYSPAPAPAPAATGASVSAEPPAEMAECVWNCPLSDAALNEFARRNRTTPSAVMLSVWLLLLSRYTGSNDVVSGMTVSGRPSEIPGADTAVGLFINTLPLRLVLDQQMSAAQLLSQVHDRQSELLEKQHSSLLLVQQCSEIRNGAPLFETNFVYENFPSAVPEGIESLVGLKMAVIYSTSRAHYPLVARVMPNADDGMAIAFEFDVRRFDRAAIEKLASHYGRLLEGIVADPARRLSQLELLDEADRRQVLVDWNRTEGPQGPQGSWGPHRCIQELFSEQAQRSPEAIALVYAEETLTYAQLEQRTSQLAHYLRSMGVGADVVVGLCVERSIEMGVGLLGILKAGGAYLPMDPDAPPERLSQMIEDAGVTVLVMGQGIGRCVAVGEETQLQIEASWEQVLQYEDAAPLPLSDPEHLAYVNYSSGSPGRPTGVMVPHRAVVNYLSWARQDATVSSLLALLMDGKAPVGSWREDAISIGRPIANTQLYVLDQQMEPVPVGVGGELYIGGAGVARGYLRKPGLTAQHFLANPYGEAGSRLYCTGDRVRYLGDGQLQFLGRLDQPLQPDSSAKSPQEYVAPATPTEQVLARIWAEALGLEDMGVEDNFFERGGHSIAAMLVVAQVHEKFAVELPIRALFEQPTVRGLARQIEVNG